MSKHSLSKGSKKFRKNTRFSFLGRKKYKGVPRILGQNPMVSKIKVLTTSYPGMLVSPGSQKQEHKKPR